MTLDEEGLNAEQAEAVAHRGSPLLVLAGAGSGKTRVITRRIARILADGARPSGLLAVTFTNKAAREMRDRVRGLVGRDPEGLFLGTFHAWGLRLLRRYGDELGLGPGFAVYDRSDQLDLVRLCLAGEPAAAESAERGLSALSRARNRLSPLPPWGGQYEALLRERGVVDFDDLLLLPLELLRRRPELVQRVRPEHLLVDEFQDTSPAQVVLLEALWPEGEDVCVVGDEDQAIYGFRGATVDNILAFAGRHPGTRVIRLVRNYRSTGAILGAASTLVGHNRSRLGKRLVAELGSGEPVEIIACPSPDQEAEVIAERVVEMSQRFGPREVAVLYRTNQQSRLLEEALTRRRLRYRVVKGLRFYERREIKDVLAYLRLLAHPADDAAFDRVVNLPARGIGAAARDEIAAKQSASRGSRMAASAELAAGGTAVGRRLQPFLELVARLGRDLDRLSVAEAIREVLERSGYGRLLAGDDREGERQEENIEELARKASTGGYGRGQAALAAFLDEVMIASDVEVDEVEPDPAGAVSLMTLHNAKGLEFDGVVISGVEEGLLPHVRATNWSERELEEERRLLYVGMTRARRSLVLTHAFGRRLWGDAVRTSRSRFLTEIGRASVRYSDLGGDGSRGPGSVAVRAPASKPAATRAAPRGEPASPFAVGSWVRHPQYGDGLVVERTGTGDSLKLAVRFQSGMRKKLVARYAPLVELGTRRRS